MFYSRAGQLVRDQEPHLLLCYRKEPHHTHGHTWTPPYLFLIHTHTFAQLDLLQISHTNMIMTEIYKPLIVMHVTQWNSRLSRWTIGTNFSTYTRINSKCNIYVRDAWNQANSHMRHVAKLIHVCISFKFIIVSYDSATKQKQYWEPLRNKEINCQWNSE